MCFLVVQISKEIVQRRSILTARAAINMNRGKLRSLRLIYTTVVLLTSTNGLFMIP